MAPDPGEIPGPRSFYPPSADLLFKRLFGDARNTEVVVGFLSSVLDLPDADWESVTFPTTHTTAHRPGGKTAILDVRVTTASGRTIDIEMQLRPAAGLNERFAYYAATLLAGQARSGYDWTSVAQAVVVVITGFCLVSGDQAYHHRYQLYDRDHRSTFTDLIDIHTLELPKLGADDGSALWDWLRFVAAADEEDLAMTDLDNPAIARAVTVVKYFNADEQARYEQWCRDKAEWERGAREHHLRTVVRAEAQMIDSKGCGVAVRL